MCSYFFIWFFFFFNDTATTEIYTLSLHDALPISGGPAGTHRDSRVKCRPHSLRSEEHTSELQSHSDLVCRLLLEKKKKQFIHDIHKENIHKKYNDKTTQNSL